MATIAGPNIIKDATVLFLDAGSRESNIKATNNMVDNSGWVVGYSQTGGWPANGDAAQNEILYDTDPWGNQSLVLKTHPNNANANGGWEGIAPGYSVSIDKTKKYRSTVWVRRTTTNSAGTFYHGLHTNGTGDIIKLDGNTETNPYWTCRSIGTFTQNEWYLHVGHIFPYGSAAMTDSTSGFWTRSGGWLNNNGCNIGGDCRFPSNATLLRQRTYHYYANDANSNIELFNPRIDLCDGTEPTIQELLNIGLSQWKDLSSSANHGSLNNGVSFDSTNGGCMVFDGTDDYFQANIGTTLLDGDPTFTIEMWVKRRTGTNIAANSGFWGMGGSGQGNSVEGWTPTANLIHLDVWDSTRLESTYYYPENQYVYICWTKSGVGQETTNVKGYYNGVEMALTKTRAATRTNQFNTSTSGIGTCLGKLAADSASYSAPINIAQFRISTRALTASEVQQNFNALRRKFNV